ncbi:MAG: squalene--hopene cyclase [Gammaproteobacteria bacterium]|nr:MAG: squalene--hopene cyclase [Gammaproteobacteria bacterium]
MDALARIRDARDTPVNAAIAAAAAWLREQQSPEGFWAGMLESNACMEAEWLLAFHVIGYRYPDTDGLLRGILERQRADGAWEIYYQAPTGDINATVESYAALRAYGYPPDAEPLRRAREWILANGGLPRTRVFTRYWLALIGEWPWQATPNLPPELIRLPRWFPFNIYNFACWARATMLPIALLSARRHVRPLPAGRRLDELFPGGRDAMDYRLPRREGWLSWSGFFLAADRILHALQNAGLTPGRRAAIARCIEWIVRHQDADGAWGGIQPPWVYAVMALHAEGYALDHPVMRRALSALEAHWTFTRGECRYLQASESPVWDTALAILAMLDCGEPADSPTLRAAAQWLLAQEVRYPGDWTQTVKGVEPGGWAFERANLHYPDIDDTAVVLICLQRLKRIGLELPGMDAAMRRATDWMLAMQSRNGGWGAFDRDNDRRLLTRIPFCDFGETLDPPSADVTAHVIEACAALGIPREHPAVQRGLAFLRAEQEEDGSWFGRWGVNHIYGTSAVLQALVAIGEPADSGWVAAAADWLAACQNQDGGWGETCASYMDPDLIGHGESTPSQTAWALLGLLAAGAERHRAAIDAGLAFLAQRQQDGSWDEPQYTGTGFPGYGVGARVALRDPVLAKRLAQGTELQRGFMINYNLYRHYFPMSALGRARRLGFDGRATAG